MTDSMVVVEIASAFIGAFAAVVVMRVWEDRRRARWFNRLLDNPPISDGDVDADALVEAIKGAGGTDTYNPPKRMGRDADKVEQVQLSPGEMP